MIISPQQLESYIKDNSHWRILIDTCSLWRISMHGNEFWNSVSPMLCKYNTRIIIPVQCLIELKRYADGTHKKSTAVKSAQAAACLQQLTSLQSRELIDIMGQVNDGTFADKVFLSVLMNYKGKYNFVIITQDSSLAQDIQSIRRQKSYRSGKEILALRYSPKNFLNDNYSDKESSPNTPTTQQNMKPKKMTTIQDKLITVSEIPGEGENALRSGYRSFCLRQRLGGGGEGDIYATNTRYIAKIYKKEKLTARRVRKIELLLQKSLNCPGICAPVEPIYNRDHQLVGYLMPKAKGKTLRQCAFGPAQIQTNFPNWKKQHTVQLCLTILDKMQYLHSRNIIMGDINPANIMLVSPTEVYFVDVDSYQLEGFPCPVGTEIFTAPEIQGKGFENFLRTIGHENFAIATLLFMIMLPGKPPYAQMGGGTLNENIRNMDFSYPLGKKSNKKTPAGVWRYMWSHLIYPIKEAFYNTFQKDGKYAREHQRLSVSDWQKLFKQYHYLLSSGKLAENDQDSESIVPAFYKGQDISNAVTCVKCGTVFPDSHNKHSTHHLCPSCRKLMNAVVMNSSCSDCGTTFSLTAGEKEYYESRNMKLPKRCPDCRARRKNSQSSASVSEPSYSVPVSTDNGKATDSESGATFGWLAGAAALAAILLL